MYRESLPVAEARLFRDKEIFMKIRNENRIGNHAETFEEFRGAGVYADLMLDPTFKKAFNPDSRNKVCLIELLNALLEGEIENPITDVHSRDKECRQGSNENRLSIFDLHCVDTLGRLFIVEVQLAKLTNIVNRAIFYTSQTIVAQGERGKGYHYELAPVITVILMDFNIFEDDEYIHQAKLRGKDGKALSDTVCYVFVELPKFDKELGALQTTLDKGLYALKNIKNLRNMPSGYEGSSFELLFQTAKLAKLTKEEQKMIDAAQKAKWDENAIREYNESQLKYGLERGLKQGLKQGLEQGLEQGIRQGWAKGMSDKAIEIAKAMKANGLSQEIISKCSGLSAEDVAKL